MEEKEDIEQIKGDNKEMKKQLLKEENVEQNKKQNEDNKNILCVEFQNKICKEIDFIILFLEILSLIPSGLIIYYTHQIYFDGEITRAISKDLFDNLNTGFFGDFNDCSSPLYENNFLFDSEDNDTNEIPLSFGEWQGTVQACKNINNKMYILDPGKSCKEDEKLIDRIPPIQLYRYKGLKICSLSDDSLSYYDLLKIEGRIIRQNEECPKGKKTCGYIDTLKNIYCIDENENCPISYIRLSKKPPIEYINDLQVIKSEKINFYYSRNPFSNSSKIPYLANTFRIADSSICALPNLYYSEIILNDLEASKKNYSSNCVLKDFSQRQTVDLMRYHKLDIIDNYELYEENGIIEKIKSKELDKFGFDFERYKNHTLYLYLRSHYGFNYTCLKEREEKSEYNALEELQASYSRADKMTEWSNLVFGLNLVPTIFSITNAITFFDVKEQWFKQIIMIGVSFGDLIFTGKRKTLDDPFEDKMTCSDIVTNDEYNIMNEKIRRSGETIHKTFISIIIQAGVYILIFVYQFFKPTLNDYIKNKKKEIKQDKAVKIDE